MGKPELKKPQRKQTQLYKGWAKSFRGSGKDLRWMGTAERSPKVGRTCLTVEGAAARASTDP